jgi:cysteine desulfurase
MKEGVYLDHHTKAQPSRAVIDAMLPFYRDLWGSPHALHQKGQELFGPIDLATSRLYEGLGADFEDHFTLTASAEEAIASLFFSTYVDFTREMGQNHFLLSALEDTIISRPMKRLQGLDCFSKFIAVDEYGRVRLDVLEEAIKPRVALLSLSWANGLTGVIQPIEDITRICRNKGIRIHVDASHVIGKLFFRFADSGIDFLTFDGARFHCPQGAAGLFCRKATPLHSLKSGEMDMNVAALTSLGLAVQEANENFDTLCTETARLRDKLESGISQCVPEAHLFFQNVDRLPTTSVIAFPGISAETMLYALNRRGLYATTGGGGIFQKLEHVLKVSGTQPYLAASAVSFSLSAKTEEEEIDRAIAIIEDAARELRTFSKDLV